MQFMMMLCSFFYCAPTRGRRLPLPNRCFQRAAPSQSQSDTDVREAPISPLHCSRGCARWWVCPQTLQRISAEEANSRLHTVEPLLQHNPSQFCGRISGNWHFKSYCGAVYEHTVPLTGHMIQQNLKRWQGQNRDEGKMRFKNERRKRNCSFTF